MEYKELITSPETAFIQENYQLFLAKENLLSNTRQSVRLVKRSIDSRSKQIKINLRFEIAAASKPHTYWQKDKLPYVANETPVLIVGAGPAGLFAAIRLIEGGLKPIVIERGKDVRTRRHDLAAINKKHIVNPESNYCFGEGGAGTYSDGKLYTRSDKRGSVSRILEILYNHGAREDVLYEAHPHIGTNKLPALVTELRETILRHGGEIHFNTKMLDIKVVNNSVEGAITDKGEILAKQLILATGHSARDVFKLLHQKGIHIEAKPFAMGVRIEHPQALIDIAQYKLNNRPDWLPAASYSLVQQVNYQGLERGVFSFCMCPGGFIVPAATEPGEVVVNGMSPSRRDSKYANSGMVVAIDEAIWSKYGYSGALAGLQFQADMEQKNFAVGGGTQSAPAQRVVDFCTGKVSNSMPDTSYIPGLSSVSLNEVLYEDIAFRLRAALKSFDQKIKGYYTNDAILVGVESRTSSPVRIPRDKESLEHPQIKGLYPSAEGAGYAGGIVSAAIDGERCAESILAVHNKLNK